MFVKWSLENKIAILIVYVDDIILTGEYEDELLRIKKSLAESFEFKDLGPLKCFLGMEVARSSTYIWVATQAYLRFA